MSDAPVDFKEQMAEARRTQILMGAAQVFAQKGYHKATTKQIARAAGVSEGTIYNYFSTKRDLLFAMVDQIAFDSLRPIVTGDAAAEPRDLLNALVRDRFSLGEKYGSLMAPLLAEIFNDIELRQALYDQILRPITDHLESYVAVRAASGEFRQIDPVVVVRGLMGALMFNFALKFSGVDSRYDDISLDLLREQIVTLFLDGLQVK